MVELATPYVQMRMMALFQALRMCMDMVSLEEMDDGEEIPCLQMGLMTVPPGM